MLIDRYLPAYDWNEVHSIEVAAAPAAVLAAVRAVTAGEMRLVGLLLWLRALPARVIGRRRPLRGGGPVLEQILRSTFVLLAELQVVKAAQEQQIGDLLDHLERVGYPAGPERVPDPVDLTPESTREHAGETTP